VGEPIWTIESADGRRRVTITVLPSGLFSFRAETFATEDGYTFWQGTHGGGLYESAEAAERAARAEIPWLRSENSN
jgi:hypothetical protein